MDPGKLIPKHYTAAAIALSFAGFLNGYDTGSIGSITHMKQFTNTMGELSASTLGHTVSVIMLTGTLPALFGGQVADKYGRLSVILPGALLFAVGAILQATAFNLAQFILGRAISGTGQGAFLANVSVYITETSPLSKRARLAALPQFMVTLGLVIGYFACYATAGQHDSFAWRLPYVIQICVALQLAMVSKALPESPRWLISHGRSEEAIIALRLLQFNMDEARRDFLSTPQETQTLSLWDSFTMLFRRAYRSRTLLALFILSVTQLSGIDAITYYAPKLFTQAGIAASNASIVASGGASIAMLLVSIPAFLHIDKWSRRTCTIFGGSTLAGIMILIGALYASRVTDTAAAARYTIVVLVFLFGMVFCATWAIVCKIYASEIQPSHARGAGNSLGMACSFMFNWFVAYITPLLLAASAYGAYFFFGGLTIIAVLVLAVYMPETRGRSLESIQADFRPRYATQGVELRNLGAATSSQVAL